ncbi:MAG: hypothetical protein A7316_06575 [Candidatus Altiarchaeales archaeon WOR_SM1_86-2]|nr:MAG: hypothetical protein A7316_06575 [Candidatus Altiarchaeales archaeon WOR_SM1_86-2]
MPDADNLINQLQERARKKARDSEKRDIEERAMEYFNDKVGYGVKKNVGVHTKKQFGESMRGLIREELLNRGVEQIQRSISDGTIKYIEECVSKQLDEKSEEYMQKETKDQILRIARGLDIYGR